MSNDNFVTVREYFQKGKFVVPCYQRGYKWSLLKNNDDKTHLDQMLIDIQKAYGQDKDQPYYLQGVTVKTGKDGIELVDGQQRTTSLYLLLLYANEKLNINSELIIYKEKDQKEHRLDYRVRKDVKEWISKPNKEIIAGNNKTNNTTTKSSIQDIAAFDEAWVSICRFFTERNNSEENEQKPDLNNYIKYVLDKVKLIYVELNTEPTKVFSMMNQDQAKMTQTELVKAELLSQASRQAFEHLDTKEEGTHEWQINHLRSHFAREWDSWLKWWNDENNYSFYNYNQTISKIQEEPQISCLLRLYWETIKKNNKIEEIGIDKKNVDKERKFPDSINTKNLFSEYQYFIADKDKKEGNKNIEAVDTFEKLRELQHILQEWYDDPVIYNWLGLMFRSGLEKKIDALIDLVETYKNNKYDLINTLNIYSKWSILGCNLKDLKKIVIKNEFTDNDESNPYIKATGIRTNLASEIVYGQYNEDAFRQLLRINIEIANEIKKKFDFFWYDSQRSLEHIQPKSKVFRKDSKYCTDQKQEDNEKAYKTVNDNNEIKQIIEKNMLMDMRNTSMGISEHCIGNLVLLNKSDNSAVGTKILSDKRNKLFERLKEGSLLLHTFQILSKSFDNSDQASEEWTIKDIEENKKYFLNKYNTCYGIPEVDSEVNNVN